MKKSKKSVEEVTQEESKFKLIDIVKNKQYYAIANLSFWFIIIVILVVIARITPDDKKINHNIADDSMNEQIKSEVVGFQSIKNKNFNFKYILSIDDKKTIFEGKQHENKILFKSDNIEYFMQDDIVLEKKDSNFVLSKNPSNIINYTDIELIEKMLLLSTVDNSGKYILSASELLKVLDLNTSSGDETIYIDVTKKNDIITGIKIDLSEYTRLTNKSIKSATLELEYYDFGLVEDFNIQK